MPPALISVATLAAVLIAARLAAALCGRLGQPRFVGEILVGVCAGPHVLGLVLSEAPAIDAQALATLSSIGLALLMFLSGTQTRHLFAREHRRTIGYLLAIGTSVPFVAVLIVGRWLPTSSLLGPNGSDDTVLVVLATASAITSIPVISRLFHDLGILRTPFASLLLGMAILDDVILWVVVAALTAATTGAGHSAWQIALHVALTTAFLGASLTVIPRWIPPGWIAGRAVVATVQAAVVLAAYMFVGHLLDVAPALSAFVAGVGVAGGATAPDRAPVSPIPSSLERVAFAVLVPIYFVRVGAQLDLGAGFAPLVAAVFFVGSSAVRVAAVAAASRASGLRWRSSLHVALTANARGGPGIVLATIVHEAGLINAGLFTALVLTAIATSQVAGVWLGRALRRKSPLLAWRADPEPPISD